MSNEIPIVERQKMFLPSTNTACDASEWNLKILISETYLSSNVYTGSPFPKFISMKFYREGVQFKDTYSYDPFAFFSYNAFAPGRMPLHTNRFIH